MCYVLCTHACVCVCVRLCLQYQDISVRMELQQSRRVKMSDWTKALIDKCVEWSLCLRQLMMAVASYGAQVRQPWIVFHLGADIDPGRPVVYSSAWNHDFSIVWALVRCKLFSSTRLHS